MDLDLAALVFDLFKDTWTFQHVKLTPFPGSKDIVFEKTAIILHMLEEPGICYPPLLVLKGTGFTTEHIFVITFRGLRQMEVVGRAGDPLLNQSEPPIRGKRKESGGAALIRRIFFWVGHYPRQGVL